MKIHLIIIIIIKRISLYNEYSELNKQLVIAVLVDMQQLQLLQLDLSALTVAESVLRTSVSAVISVSTYDRTTDNYISAVNTQVNTRSVFT